MMKKVLAMAALVLALFACKKEGTDDPVPTPAGGGITGVWELTSVTTKVAVGDVQVSVFVEFTADKNFTLYQKIGEGRYTQFSGTYVLSSDNKLSGSYSGGASWGPYDAAVSGETLTLTSAGGKEVDTYKKISAVPDTVIGNLY